MYLLEEILKQTYQILTNIPPIQNFFKDIYTAYRIPQAYPALYFEIANMPDTFGYYGAFTFTANFVIFSYDENVSLFQGFDLLLQHLDNQTFRFLDKKLSIHYNYSGLLYTDKDLDRKLFYLQSSWDIFLIKWN